MGGEQPAVGTDAELEALQADLQEKEAEVAAAKKSFSNKLKELEASLEGADVELRAQTEAMIDKMKAHPPISVRKAVHERDVAEAVVEKKTQTLIEKAKENIDILTSDL